MKLRFLKFYWLRRPFSFQSIRLGIYLLLISLIPILSAVFLTEVFINDRMTFSSFDSSSIITDEYNVKFLIYYLSFGLTHLLLSTVIIIQFKNIIKSNLSSIQSRNIIKVSFIVWFFSAVLVYILDYFKINIAFLSHENLYAFLRLNDYFSNYFQSFPKDIIGTDIEIFYFFSLLPFTFIVMGVGVLVWGCFSISKEISTLNKSKLDSENFQNGLELFFKKFKSNIYLLSIVLVTSTIATIFYFKLPNPIINSKNLLSKYSDLSISMGIFWGVMFSVTLLFLCIGSYSYLNRYIKRVLNEEKLVDNSSVRNFLDKNMEFYSIVNNIQLIITILSPSIASIIGTGLIQEV
jgi:hypothetical protein